jgi:hypothetical protein
MVEFVEQSQAPPKLLLADLLCEKNTAGCQKNYGWKESFFIKLVIRTWHKTLVSVKF